MGYYRVILFCISKRSKHINLEKYRGKKVKIKDIDGKEWIGFVSGFTDKNNNPEEKDSIDLKINYNIYEIFEDEIKSIKTID